MPLHRFFGILAAIGPAALGCAAVTDPSCGPHQELCRPVCCPPVETRCDRFSDELWYRQPNCWTPPCAPLSSCYPQRSRHVSSADALAIPD